MKLENIYLTKRGIWTANVLVYNGIEIPSYRQKYRDIDLLNLIDTLKEL